MKKRDRNTFLLVEGILAALLLAVLALMTFRTYYNDPKKIVIPLHDEENVKWSGVKYGAKMAAQDSNSEVSFEEAEDSDETKTSFFADVNSREWGKGLADAILSQYENGLGGKTIGILYSKDEGNAVISECLDGFLEGISDQGAEVLWMLELNGAAGETEKIRAAEKVDLIAAMDNDSLLEAAVLSKQRDLHGALVNGVGQCTDAIYYLDDGAIESLIVPDVFMIGYQGYKKALNSDYENEEPIGYYSLHRGALFTEENQALIYTLSQLR